MLEFASNQNVGEIVLKILKLRSHVVQREVQILPTEQNIVCNVSLFLHPINTLSRQVFTLQKVENGRAFLLPIPHFLSALLQFHDLDLSGNDSKQNQGDEHRERDLRGRRAV